MRVSIPPIYAITGLQIDGDVDFLDTYKLLRLSAPATGGALRKGKAEIVNADVAAGAGILSAKIQGVALVRTLFTTQGDLLIRGADAPERFAKIATGYYLRATATGYEAVAALTATEIATLISNHAALVTVHQDAPALIATHAAIATVHQDAPALIAVHAALADAHPFILGDLLLVAADAERMHSEGSYTKVKEIELGKGGVLRVKFDLKSHNVYPPAYGKIYRNGTPVGTEQTTASTTYVNFSEDISGWSAGDLLQLYTHSTASGRDSWAKNLRVYVGAYSGALVITD